MENKVLAIVDGREIKESDLNILIKNLGQNSAYFQGEAGRKKLIDELVMHELMYSDAVEKNLESEEEFIEVFKDMKRSMLQQYNLRKMFNSITITEDELKDFYEKNKNLYNRLKYGLLLPFPVYCINFCYFHKILSILHQSE